MAHPMEKVRRNENLLHPIIFFAKKLRMYDEYNPNEKVMSLSQAAVVEKKEDIVFAWIDNAKLEQQLSLSVLNSLTRIEVLTLRNAGLTTTEKISLPNLLYCDISNNAIADRSGLTPLYFNSQYIQYLDFRKNPS